MKVWVIGHPEAVQGFALVGVFGIIAESVESVNQALDRAQAEIDIGIVLVTTKATKLAHERMDQLRRHSGTPIFLEIPDPDGMDPTSTSLTDVVNQAIGINR